MSDELADLRIGFIGAGAMASALVSGLIAAGIAAPRIRAADPDPERRKQLEQRTGATTTADNAALAEASDLIVLAVKPGIVPGVLAELRESLEVSRPLWVSIAAGVPVATLEGALSHEARVVRAMPNTPALVRAGATAFCGNAAATATDLAAARALFEGVGVCWIAPNEALLDAVTGLSGSGPAYVFVFLEALGDAGVRMGLPRETADQLALQTVFGSAKMALEQGLPPSYLRDQVTSPGGTTVAGLERLEAAGFRTAVDEAVAAATRRSRELGAKARAT